MQTACQVCAQQAVLALNYHQQGSVVGKSLLGAHPEDKGKDCSQLLECKKKINISQEKLICLLKNGFRP